MGAPKVSCIVSIDCSINPSEDLKKIRHALANIFPGVDFEEKNFRVHGATDDLECLDGLRERIHNKQHFKSFGRQIRLNTRGDSFWFYLNKQAAFAGEAALCEHDDESPLGPIRVSVTSGQIETVSEWLA